MRNLRKFFIIPEFTGSSAWNTSTGTVEPICRRRVPRSSGEVLCFWGEVNQSQSVLDDTTKGLHEVHKIAIQGEILNINETKIHLIL
jgi:hypothetical protein